MEELAKLQTQAPSHKKNSSLSSILASSPANRTDNSASNAMCTFLILNMSSLQLIPINMIAYGSDLPFSAQAARLDLPVCLLVGAIATVPALIASKFRRWQGVVLLVVYFAYVTISCLGIVA